MANSPPGQPIIQLNPTTLKPATTTPSTTSTPGVPNDKITGAVVVIIATGLMAVLAGFNEQFGKVLMIIMVGFLIGWLLTSGSQNDLTRWISLMSGPATDSAATLI
jgi:hypothetical protein